MYCRGCTIPLGKEEYVTHLIACTLLCTYIFPHWRFAGSFQTFAESLKLDRKFDLNWTACHFCFFWKNGDNGICTLYTYLKKHQKYRSTSLQTHNIYIYICNRFYTNWYIHTHWLYIARNAMYSKQRATGREPHWQQKQRCRVPPQKETLLLGSEESDGTTSGQRIAY